MIKEQNPTYDDIYAEHYDLLSQHKDYAEETKSLDNLITSLSVNKKAPIIDIGCGTGSHAIELSKLRGNPICGFDTSGPMIRKALSKSSTVDFISGEMSNVYKQHYSFAFSLFNVVNCLDDLVELTQFFLLVNAVLKSDRHFFFEFWNSALVSLSPPNTIIREYFSEDKKIMRTVEPDNSELNSGKLKLEYKVDVITDEEIQESFTRVHLLTIFSFEEIEACLKDADFEIIFHRGALPDLSKSVKNARMTSVLTKKIR
tara:strand:- start:189 stop:962 length:774 start_codon:yes stop_codon:yes gene_type:complete